MVGDSIWPRMAPVTCFNIPDFLHQVYSYTGHGSVDKWRLLLQIFGVSLFYQARWPVPWQLHLVSHLESYSGWHWSCSCPCRHPWTFSPTTHSLYLFAGLAIIHTVAKHIWTFWFLQRLSNVSSWTTWYTLIHTRIHPPWTAQIISGDAGHHLPIPNPFILSLQLGLTLWPGCTWQLQPGRHQEDKCLRLRTICVDVCLTTVGNNSRIGECQG